MKGDKVMNVVWKVAEAAQCYFESRNIGYKFTDLVKNANKWYGFYPWLDVKSLTALTIENPNNFIFSMSEIEKLKAIYF